jgi:membrane-bound metal-dependent hydrolase YbcI (DUF457 family)
MDIFTHAFSGLAAGNITKNKNQKKIILVLLISALFPDIDGLALLFSGKLEGHRLLTHSLIFSLVFPVICASAFYFIYKKKVEIYKLYVASLFGVLIHIFLDSLIVWGSPLFYPFSDKFYSFNIYLAVIDPYLFSGYIILFLLFALHKLDFFKLNIRKAIGIMSGFVILIFISRFAFQLQANRLTTLTNPLILPYNEEINDYFFQRHWKAIVSENNQFIYEIIDIYTGKIIERNARQMYLGTNDCPEFTKKYLYTENNRIGDIRYTSHLINDPKLPQNCLFGEKI